MIFVAASTKAALTVVLFLVVNEDKSIQEQRLIKTLKKILNKSDRKII